mmetsp:Transcript_17140/g.60152  ORF Transcript_17140/g.60152 Transcript_17140/m.60152 type:complete len:200 (-) Transcript_17140:245-844(-)
MAILSALAVSSLPSMSSGTRSNLPLWPCSFIVTRPVARPPVRQTVSASAAHAVSTTSPSGHVEHAVHVSASSSQNPASHAVHVAPSVHIAHSASMSEHASHVASTFASCSQGFAHSSSRHTGVAQPVHVSAAARKKSAAHTSHTLALPHDAQFAIASAQFSQVSSALPPPAAQPLSFRYWASPQSPTTVQTAHAALPSS